MQLSFAPQTKDEVLIVSVKGVSPSALMAKIVEVADAKRVKTDTGYRLERPAEIIKAEEAKQFSDRVESITAAINKRA